MSSLEGCKNHFFIFISIHFTPFLLYLNRIFFSLKTITFQESQNTDNNLYFFTKLLKNG